MKTRMEIWKNYRNEINNNIKLQEAVESSNDALNILNKRLLNAFPSYNEKYKLNINKNIETFFKEINKKPHFSSLKIDEFLNKIKKLSMFSENLHFIDNIDFSSHEIDHIIVKIKEKNDKLQDENKKNKFNDKKFFLKNFKNQKIQIAIDGPSSSGKSTVAKILAKKYNLKYLNTGLVYRAIALNININKININVEKEVVATLEDGMIKLSDNNKVFLKGVDVTSQLKNYNISQIASKISIYNNVRKWAKLIQKQYSSENRIIMDGRDTTFNIMPNANIKIFLETSPEERAKRRANEIKDSGMDVNLNELKKEIQERDYRDKNRTVDPLHKVKDAHLINSTKLSIEDVVLKISQIIERISNE